MNESTDFKKNFNSQEIKKIHFDLFSFSSRPPFSISFFLFLIPQRAPTAPRAAAPPDEAYPRLEANPLEARSVVVARPEARPDPAVTLPLESILEAKPAPAELEDTADTRTGTD